MQSRPGGYHGAGQVKFLRHQSTRGTAIALTIGIAAIFANAAASAQSVEDLQRLSIDDLTNVQVYSVSKSSQRLSDAPAAVYVITHDEIMRSGATNLADILRLAPNLQVAQMSADSWAVTARGFNGNAADKLLVLIDGRSVYTPLYGGVLWDEKDVSPENIERIEVISGPGATLWGANAVNGVINIITRKSADTQGGVLDVGAGNRESRASLQYGGKLDDDLDYRVDVEGFRILGDKMSNGASAEDGWSKGQGGFRLDWTPQGDTITFEGNYYRGEEDATPTLDQDISGGNFQVTWQHRLDDGSSLQILAYYDGTRRYTDGLGYSLDTYDLEIQHSLTLGTWNDVVWGAGYRAYQDQFNLFNLLGTPFFQPPHGLESLSDIFAQDTMSLGDSIKLVLGLKLEDDPGSGLAPLPNMRLSWKPNDDVLLWAAASRAVRAPTLFDRDLVDVINLLPPPLPVIPPFYLTLAGDPNFRAEQLTAYEIGARVQPMDALTFSVSTYYNVYDDLRSVEAIQETTFPFVWMYGNNMEGSTYGVEIWGDYQVAEWWRLSSGFNLLHEDLRFKPGSSALGGVASAGDDPRHQASLRSTMNLGGDVSWELDLRNIGRLPNPVIPNYVEINSRLAWEITKSLELSISGFNLLHARHLEYEEAGATVGDEVERSFFVETKWRF